MDKTLEIVVAAAVLMMIGAFLFFMLSDSSGDFSDATNTQITDSQCELWMTQGKCGEASQCEWSQPECENRQDGNYDEDNPYSDNPRVE